MRRRWKLSAFILLVMMVAVMAALISHSIRTPKPEFSGLPSERPTETPPYRRARLGCTAKEINDYYQREHWARVREAECSFAADLLAAYLEEYGTDSNAVLAAHSLFEGLAAVAMAQPRESRAPIMRVLRYPYSPFRLGHDLAAIRDLQACAVAERSPSGMSGGSNGPSTGTQDSRGWALWSRTPSPQLSHDLNDYFASTVHSFDATNPGITARSIESWLAHEASLQSADLDLSDRLQESELILAVSQAQHAAWLLEPTPAEGVFRRANGKIVPTRILRFRRNFVLYLTDEYERAGVRVLADVDLAARFFRVTATGGSRQAIARVVSKAVTDSGVHPVWRTVA